MKIGVGWPYLLELVPIEARSAHASAFGVIGATFGIIGAFYFIFVSNNAYTFCAIGYLFQILTLFLTVFIPESPVYLFF